jgi:hypothetical protein
MSMDDVFLLIFEKLIHATMKAVAATNPTSTIPKIASHERGAFKDHDDDDLLFDLLDILFVFFDFLFLLFLLFFERDTKKMRERERKNNRYQEEEETKNKKTKNNTTC